MRRTDSTTCTGTCAVWSGAIRGGALAIVMMFLASAPAAALQANFDSTAIGFIPSSAVLALPRMAVDLSTPLLSAGDSSAGASFDVDFLGSAEGSICILANTLPGVCQANLTNVTTAYSILVTLEIDSINSSQINGPFTLAISMLRLNYPNGDVYTPGEVSIDLDPTAPVDLDTSAVPGFHFNEIFDSLIRIEDSACTNSSGNCQYLGWTIDGGVGDTVSFRFDIDMSIAENGRDTPSLLFNAFPTVIPEPNTALLLGLGLAGLSIGAWRVDRGGNRNK